MPDKPISKMSELELRKHLEHIEAALHAESTLFSEYLLTKQALEAKLPGSDPIYSNAATVFEAIKQALAANGRAMTKSEVFEDLVAGGFRLPANSGRTLVGNTMNYHRTAKHLVRRGDHFGLPTWGDDKFIEL